MNKKISFPLLLILLSAFYNLFMLGKANENDLINEACGDQGVPVPEFRQLRGTPNSFKEFEKNTEKAVSQSKNNEEIKAPERILIDEIVCLAHGPERSQIFCHSDQVRRGIDSRIRNLDDLVADELIYQDALHVAVPIDDIVVKEHLERTVRSFGLKPGEEGTIFAQEGYSYQEGFEQFRMMYGVNMMIDHRIRAGLFVPEEDVIAYYNAHPIVKEPAYQLQTYLVPLQEGRKFKGLRQDVTRFIKSGKGLDVAWSDPYWIKESDIADELSFLTEMNPGEIKDQELTHGIQLYRLCKKKMKREVPLKKRYHEILNALQRPLFENKLTAYKQKLLNNATIIYNQSIDAALAHDETGFSEEEENLFSA